MASEHPQPLNVVVVRRIRVGRESDYEAAMRSFATWAMSQPGAEGFQNLRPPAGGRDYTVVARFRDEAARRAFTDSDGYRHWMEVLAEMTDGETVIQELVGLESWFTSPAAPALARLPAWKMAISTFCGVLPASILLDRLIGPVIGGWPYLLRFAVFAAAMVALLTWVVMPLVTRVLRPFLFPSTPRAPRSER